MRNPFARLAHRDPARPSLRERAISLKASAARVIRRDPAGIVPAAATDPILAAIAETQRLTLARAAANDLPIPDGDLGPLPEQNAAIDAQFAHIDNVLLKTVPTTAAGCAALACYALDFLAADGWALDEDEANNQHVRILDLIARSPLR